MPSSLELVVKKGPAKGQILSLEGRRSVTIGRSPSNTLVISDEKVSSHHARVDVSTSGVILTDLGSKNGTFAGGESVTGSRVVAPGVEIAIGTSLLELRWKEAVAESPSQSDRIAAAAIAAVAACTIERVPTSRDKLDAVRDVVLAPATHPSQRNLTKAQRNLAVLTEVGDLISTERDSERFLARLMDLVFDVLPADRGTMLLVDEKTGEAVPRVTRCSPRADGDEIVVSRTILSKVLSGVSILTADAGADSQLAQRASIVAQNIRSAICVPVRGRRKSIGAIYVDTVISIGVFGRDDLEMLSTVGVLTGTALENIQLFRENLQQERMAAIGKVIAGLGHDIRNMLSALRGGMYLIDETLKSSAVDDVKTAWGVVKHGHESIASLVQDMVNYSKPREPDWKLADVNQVVSAALAYVKGYAASKDIQFTEMLDPTIGPFYFDPHSIERCVMNLMTNAVDAVDARAGVVSVSTQVDDAHRCVRAVVQDNGEGIPAEHRDRIFDLLFSTKGQRGTGFGLAITKKIVEEHGGHVWLVSEVGRGTSFTIELPLREHRPAVASPISAVAG